VQTDRATRCVSRNLINCCTSAGISCTANHPFHGHYTGQPASVGTSSQELEDVVGGKFYCPHALADGNQRIRIREKTLEFSSTVLSTLSPYRIHAKSKYGVRALRSTDVATASNDDRRRVLLTQSTCRRNSLSPEVGQKFHREVPYFWRCSVYAYRSISKCPYITV